jgi:hypothetical protein
MISCGTAGALGGMRELSSFTGPNPCPVSLAAPFVPHSCPMCSHTSGDDRDFMRRLTDFHDDHVGKMCSMEIYTQCVEFYDKEYLLPMQRAGQAVPAVTVAMFQTHFEDHTVNVLRSLVEQIHIVESQMRHVRENGMCRQRGRMVSADPSNTRLYLQLGKQCQELYSQYVAVRAKRESSVVVNPPKFYNPTW